MTLLADKDRRFKNLFGKATIFLALAAVGIALTFLLTGIKKGLFTPKEALYFIADSGQGLSEGMPVKLSGFRIGFVESIALEETGRVKVKAGIEQKYFRMLREDVVVHLRKENVIGDPTLDISQGSAGKKKLASGGTVLFERSAGLEQVAINVRDRLLPILDDLHDLLHNQSGSLRQTVENLREFSAEIRTTREHLDRLIVHADNSLTREVSPMVRSLQNAAERADRVSLQLEQSLPGLIEKTGSTLDSMKQTSVAVGYAANQSSARLPELIGETRDVVHAVGSSWPVRNMLPVPESGPLKMDSHD